MAKRKVVKLSFTQILGKMYPRGERPLGCPMPIRCLTTLVMERTPIMVIRHLVGLEKTFGPSELCWLDCTLECPARRHVEELLDAALKK